MVRLVVFFLTRLYSAYRMKYTVRLYMYTYQSAYIQRSHYLRVTDVETRTHTKVSIVDIEGEQRVF